MSMVERVAKALHEMPGYGYEWETASKTQRRHAREYARAAIEAMREPSIFMLRRADNAIISDERFESGPYESDKFTWETMISAALNEEG